MTNKAKPLSLLEQAKQISRMRLNRQNISEEDHIQLSIAFMAMEITLTQLARVVWPGKDPRAVSARIYIFVAIGLKKAYEQGKIIRAD